MNNDVAFWATLSLLLVGLWAYKKTALSILWTLLFLLLMILSSTLLIGYGASNYFTANGIDETVIYHLKYGLEDAGFSEYSIFILLNILSVLILFFSLLFYIKKFKNSGNHGFIWSAIVFFSVFLSLIMNPALWDLYKLGIISNYGNLFKAYILGLNKEYDVNNFYRYYKIPKKIRKNDQMNFIIIYAESLEKTYFDDKLFPGLIKELKKLESVSTYNFTNIQQVNEAKWTIAGMVASQCGIPLITPSSGNSMSGMDEYLPQAICLGDVLKRDGYNLIYMGGASTRFAGKGKFYKSHGFDEVLGREELISELDDMTYQNGWGLYDDSLFNLVYKRFLSLSRQGKKFGLVTLSLDTHHPEGHPSRSCKNIKYMDGKNPILNAVACSDYLISSFIDKVRHSPYGYKTIIVLASDHLALRNTAYDLLSNADRRNLFMIFDPRQKERKVIDVSGTTLDIGATMLSLLGYRDELGLGRNLIDETKDEERALILNQLQEWRVQLSDLWDFPKIGNQIKIFPKNKYVSIDDRHFNIPILIDIDNKLKSVLRFDFDSPKKDDLLISQAKVFIKDKDKNFILINKCGEIQELGVHSFGYDYCVMIVIGGEIVKLTKLSSPAELPAEYINGLLRSKTSLQNRLSFLVISDIEPGHSVYFSVQGKGLQYLGKGWSYPEKWGIWSIGKTAILGFRIKDYVEGEYILTINSNAYVNDQHPEQRIIINVNDELSKTFTYRWKRTNNDIKLKINSKIIKKNNGVVLVEFKFENPISPADLGRSADKRLLGLGLVSMNLSIANN